MSVRIALSRTARKVLQSSQLVRPICALRIDVFGGVQQQQHGLVGGNKRWMTTKPDEEQKSELLYEGPMSTMITSLKVFSLSSAFISTVGLPALMVWRGMDLFTGLHMTMVFTTMAGSWASTFGLQYIFAPYVYTLEMIPVRKCDYVDQKKVVDGEDNNAIEATEEEQSTATPKGDFLLKATTRSILATKVEHVFDPETDIKGVPGGTLRPFCSFFAKGKPLYIHEQMITDPKLSQNLFINQQAAIQKQKNPDPDDEFL